MSLFTVGEWDRRRVQEFLKRDEENEQQYHVETENVRIQILLGIEMY